MRGNSSARTSRQALIKRILEEQIIADQKGLLEALRSIGILVNQSSISRDLQTLGVIKSRGRYVLSATTTPETADELKGILGRILKVETAGANLMVIHTPQGMAPAVGVALDKVGLKEIMGTISGDDTLFIATASRREQMVVEQLLSKMMTAT